MYFIKCLLIASCLLPTFSVVAESCAPDRIDEVARIERVIDGDTVQLDDGRHLRLIGINAMETGKDGQPSEPYADEASDALASLLKSQTTVGIRLDVERLDQYHRLLAHLYTSGSQSVEEWMLANGYALLITIPPNLWNLECYRQAEKRAQIQEKGLWSRPYYKVMDSVILNNEAHGFHVVKGLVRDVGETDKSLWLNLEGELSIRIDRSDLPYFDGMRIVELKNHEVMVRGWVHHDNDRPVIRLRHAVSLQVLN